MRIFFAIAALASLLVSPASAAPVEGFSYSYPAAARAIPALRASFEADAAKQRREFAASTASAKAEARRDGYVYHPHSLEMAWSVVASLPRFLSLSLAGYSYTGGAHGMPLHGTTIWDRQTKRRLDPLILFTSRGTLRQALQGPFCRELDRMRVARRGGPIEKDGIFDQCIDPTEHPLLLGSAGKRAFDRLTVVVGPYAAGSYAEGTYEVNLPVSQALVAALKPEYRPFFSAGR